MTQHTNSPSSAATLDGDRADCLRAELGNALTGRSGRMIGPRDADYASARLLYNRMHDLYPAAIVQTLDPTVLAVSLRAAAAKGVPVAMRGGGHHIAGFGSCDHGIVLDFSPFRRVSFDPTTGTVEADAGARLADVDRVLCRAGRVIPLGTVSETGLAGLTLGGGIGWLVGVYGLTCDHLIGADVILADGTRVRAEDNADLLWALRGGGGNFGVVTRFRFRTRPLPATLVGTATLPMANAGAALVRLSKFLSAGCPAQLTVAPRLGHFDSRPGLAIDFCITGREGATSIIERLRTAVGDGTWRVEREADFASWQAAQDHAFLPAMRGYWKCHYMPFMPEERLHALVASMTAAPIPGRSILIEHLHGAYRLDRSCVSSAFPLRWAQFGVLIAARWKDASADDANIAWVRSVHASLGTAGVSASYSNYTPADDSRAIAAYAGPIANRLARVKAQFDPNNLFRRNHNIVPNPAAPR